MVDTERQFSLNRALALRLLRQRLTDGDEAAGARRHRRPLAHPRRTRPRRPRPGRTSAPIRRIGGGDRGAGQEPSRRSASRSRVKWMSSKVTRQPVPGRRLRLEADRGGGGRAVDGEIPDHPPGPPVDRGVVGEGAGRSGTPAATPYGRRRRRRWRRRRHPGRPPRRSSARRRGRTRSRACPSAARRPRAAAPRRRRSPRSRRVTRALNWKSPSGGRPSRVAAVSVGSAWSGSPAAGSMKMSLCGAADAVTAPSASAIVHASSGDGDRTNGRPGTFQVMVMTSIICPRPDTRCPGGASGCIGARAVGHPDRRTTPTPGAFVRAATIGRGPAPPPGRYRPSSVGTPRVRAWLSEL